MTGEKIYRLRGHHIERIKEYYIKFHAQDYIPLINVLKNMTSNNKRDYDDETIERLVSFTKEITKEKDAKILVVGGIDDMCRLCGNIDECKKKVKSDILDSIFFISNKLKLKIGDIINVEDMLTIL